MMDFLVYDDSVKTMTFELACLVEVFIFSQLCWLSIYIYYIVYSSIEFIKIWGIIH